MKQTQTISVESLNLLERALYILQDGICIVERDFTISYINSAAQDLLEKQFCNRPVVGNSVLDFLNEERIEKPHTQSKVRSLSLSLSVSAIA